MKLRLVLAWVAVTACSFTADSTGGDAGNPAGGDGGVDALPEPSVCATVGVAECAGDVVRTCVSEGQLPVETTCAWGCAGASPGAACVQLAPSGGWETQATGDTTSFTGLEEVTLPDGAILNGDDGSISGAAGAGSFRADGTGTAEGIDYQQRVIGMTAREVGVYRFRKLTISKLNLTGTRAIALVADEGITITGVVDGVPACLVADTRTPGPGGYPGGLNAVSGQPTPPGGGGTGGATGNDQGGGGGGHGAIGGDGGNRPDTGGAVFGDAGITLLVGGGGGGGGDNHSNAGHGGGGGAAIHLVANGPIVISGGATGGVNAGGCGGREGDGSNDGGGGGGAGGAILIEAPAVMIGATLAVNGGGGGGGSTGGGVNSVGQKGQLSRTPATGGPAGDGSVGGGGAAGGGSLTGGVGTDGDGGGGGGGIGRIRINTRAGAAIITSATLSPGPNAPGTTYSEGTATVR